MRRMIILVGFLSLLILNSSGQEKSNKVDILWGDEQKESKKTTLSDIVGHDETGIYALKTKRKGFYGMNSTITLEHYNNKLNQTNSVSLELIYQKKKMNFEFIIHHNNELYLYSSFINKKLNHNFLFVQTINKKTLQFNQDIKKIAEIDYTGRSIVNIGNFNYEVSRDSSKVLVYYNLPYVRYENEQYGFHVFDEEMNQLWENKVTLPYMEELLDVEDFKIDDKGNVHLLGVIYKEKRKAKRKGEPNYKYQIISYFDKGNEVKEYPIMIEGKFLTDMKIAITDDKDVICSGFYSNEGLFSIIGAYFIKVDGETKEIIAKNFKEFGIDFITQNMTDRQEKKAKKKAEKGKEVELIQYDLDNIVLRDDGGAVLIGEQYFVRMVTRTMSNGNGGTTTTTSYYYFYNDIIVINISPEGNIEWTEKIPKRQKTANDGGFYSSYAMSVVKDKLYFVFNDHPENLTYKGEGKLYNFIKSKESLIVLVELDSNGKQTREALFSAREADILTRPKVCKQISKKEMILFGQRRKAHRFAKILFKE
ncbi:MAG: hypothetical protein GQ564_10660 [Bacteroidales bacterium]|nr:hypothetical protein [Bacteroidales bacterium]